MVRRTTYSGFENKAKQALEERIKSLKREAFFGEILVPAENVVELVKGQKAYDLTKVFSRLYSGEDASQ